MSGDDHDDHNEQDGASFRQRLDAVLRRRNPGELHTFLVSEGQWQPEAQTDEEAAMWMMIAASPVLADLHAEAERWLLTHGHEHEARAILGRGKSQRTASRGRGGGKGASASGAGRRGQRQGQGQVAHPHSGPRSGEKPGVGGHRETGRRPEGQKR